MTKAATHGMNGNEFELTISALQIDRFRPGVHYIDVPYEGIVPSNQRGTLKIVINHNLVDGQNLYFKTSGTADQQDFTKSWSTFVGGSGETHSGAIEGIFTSSKIGEEFTITTQVLEDNDRDEYISFDFYADAGYKEKITSKYVQIRGSDQTYIPPKQNKPKVNLGIKFMQYRPGAWSGLRYSDVTNEGLENGNFKLVFDHDLKEGEQLFFKTSGSADRRDFGQTWSQHGDGQYSKMHTGPIQGSFTANKNGSNFEVMTEVIADNDFDEYITFDFYSDSDYTNKVASRSVLIPGDGPGHMPAIPTKRFNFWFDESSGHLIIADGSTYIPERRFENLRKIESVSIPDSVVMIEDYAFSKTSLTELVIPKSVNAIGRGAFTGNKLESIVIPDSIDRIWDDAFSYNELKSIDLGDGVVYIGNNAFTGNQLTDIEFGDSVSTIGNGAFSKNNLKKLLIGGNVTSIGNSAFLQNELEHVEIGDYVFSIGDSAFSGNQNQNQISSVAIGDNVRMIGVGAFKYNKLKSIEIADSVTTIKGGAFAWNQLEEVGISKSVTAIGSFGEDGAFTNNNFRQVVLPDQFKDSPPFNGFDFGVQFFFGNEQPPTIPSNPETDMGGNVIGSIAGAGKLRGTKNADQFTFGSFELFRRKNADKIYKFDATEGDKIAVSPKAFPGLQDVREINFACTRSKRTLMKLSRKDYDFIYYEEKGHLYFDGNKQEKGWGNYDEGGIVAKFIGMPNLTDSDFTVIG